MSGFTLEEVKERTLRTRDSWWTVAFADPLAVRLVRVIANRTRITPNQLTVSALFLGLGAAAAFAVAWWPFLLLGALLYYLCFLVDCMDGKLARLTDRETLFGSWMDYLFDRLRVLVCAIALMGGQYVLTGQVVFVWMALAVVFVDMLRYLNALQVYKVRREMRSRIAGALERARAELSMLEPEDTGARRPLSDQGEQAVLRHGISVLEHILRTQTEKESRYDRDAGKQPDVRLPKVDLHQEFRSRFPWYQRFWEFLRAHRVRTHLVSGIEFQMAVFVLAPLAGAAAPSAIVAIAVIAGVLLLAFEVAIVYKLWLSTLDFFRVVDGIEGALGFTRSDDPGGGASEREATPGSSQATTLR
ncbi:CDP-alcohol phosphatidyltransferase family protein [Streptomonospora nanhaiensis]|uniref:Phosphatidylglycerophosphate synthase n=1 Tax=Streptomonospora nanhaiensis TaxID=1323731 RepID=A0A853BRG7_9ACTN|nr:CDP-alcohol phosphatidyltransferase family protein [Streptomonospora nanhaiensis]MBV2362662.1 CDP-alcohol phosphatidyltransferase family protein [Streptomonospora nanhaiensis]MBX9387297.1 CDP-alcohol phosphatidyltransferase family protein [Streptomonospora nanhaiensis]NYI97988.1 phosphatidylglycerophosphate synthase [Streptomonospora nanhaiensis]